MENGRKNTIVFVSMEFGIDDTMPLYAGGLGILSGDVLKEAIDQQIPFVGVSLLYRHGFFSQKITDAGIPSDGRQHWDPEVLLKRATAEDGSPLIISVPLENRDVHVAVWMLEKGSVTLLLLDSDVPENSDEDKQITDALYPENHAKFLKQMIVLGLGCMPTLHHLHIQPAILHLNESPTVFVGIDVRKQPKTHFPRIVFMNHTLLPGGNGRYNIQELLNLTKRYRQIHSVELEEDFVAAHDIDEPTSCSFTTLSMHVADRVSAVSPFHARLASTIWPDKPFQGIANGIHLPTWVHPDIYQLITENTPNPSTRYDESLKLSKLKAKQELITVCNTSYGAKFDADICTLVWARRIVPYKQPDILLSDPVKLAELLTQEHPIQLIISGKSHAADPYVREYFRTLYSIIHDPRVLGKIIFIPDYSIRIAKPLLGGADVWVNTPKRGLEACGTSTMKAIANGTLLLTTKDGWLDDIHIDQIGWELNDASTVYSIINRDIIPLYYEPNKDEWMKKVKNAISLSWESYSTKRLLQDYFQKLYN